MTLLAYSVGFGEPGGNLAIDLVHALKAKGVQMISRRKSFDAAKARILQASCQDNVPVDPILPE